MNEKNSLLSENCFRSASVHECTGLIPAGIPSDAEIEAYNEMYSFIPTAEELSRRYIE